MNDEPRSPEPTETPAPAPPPAEPADAGRLPSWSGDDWVLPTPEPPLESGGGLLESAGASPEERLIETVTTLGIQVNRKLDALQTLLDRELRAEATREKVVDRLHAELQEYKQDLLLSMLRPVFIDLIQLHDDIGKVAVAGLDAHPEAERLVALMQGFRQGIEDILYRQGVEPFEVERETFDARRQRVGGTVVTDDPARHKAVAARVRKGFQAGDRVIRPEIVSVFAYRASDSSA
jgi:molecular chaperone GrpE